MSIKTTKIEIVTGATASGTILTGITSSSVLTQNYNVIPTEGHVKDYVDGQIGTNNDLSEILTNGNTTGDNYIRTNDSVVNYPFLTSTNLDSNWQNGSFLDLNDAHFYANTDNGTDWSDLILEGTSATISVTNTANGTRAKLIVDQTGIGMFNGGITNKWAYFDLSNILTSNKTFTFPNATGTIALTSDIPTNYVTTDTTQTISGDKTVSGDWSFQSGLTVSDITASGDTYLSGNTYAAASSYTYIGSPTADGSWRWYITPTGNLTFEKRESGSWVCKASFQ